VIRKIACLLVILLLFYSLPSLAEQRASFSSYSLISGEVGRAVTMEVRTLNVSSEETIEIHPYKADVSGLKNELELYRKMYLVVAIVIMAGLMAVAHAK